MDNVPFLQSRYFKRIPDETPRTIQLIVLHTTENTERNGTAMAIAKYFQTEMKNAQGQSRVASFHYCIDAKQVVQCVRIQDVAYGAPGTNHNGIHIEHVGFSAQTVEQWRDNFSIEELSLSAQLVSEICLERKLPVIFVPAMQLLAGDAGITTHVEVTKACLIANRMKIRESPFFNKQNPSRPLTDHTDPGNNFPMEAYLEAVRSFAL